jgi:uncharacterized BrkB/YihY/UPF0761 family membrane protein
VIFLVWLWISNAAVLFGAALDAELERDVDRQSEIADARDLGATQPATPARTTGER